MDRSETTESAAILARMDLKVPPELLVLKALTVVPDLLVRTETMALRDPAELLASKESEDLKVLKEKSVLPEPPERKAPVAA